MTARRVLLAGAAALCAWNAQATDWDASLDMRLVAADAPTSFIDGGLGMLRYGDDRDGAQLGRARLAVSQELGDLLTLKIDASAWGSMTGIRWT